MYKKTTDAIFARYGFIYKHKYMIPSDFIANKHDSYEYNLVSKLYHYEKEIFISSNDETAILVIQNDEEVEFYSIHKVIKLKPNIKFNIIVNKECDVSIYKTTDTVMHEINLNEPITLKSIQSSFTISEIYAYFYNVKGPGYTFDESSNDYFELIYVDNGILDCSIDENHFQINEYEAILIANNQKYSHAVKSRSTSYLSIIFNISIDDVKPLINRKFLINKEALDIINRFIKTSESNLPYDNDLKTAYLKVLISEMLNSDFKAAITKPTPPINQQFKDEMLSQILTFIDENIYDNLYLDTICVSFCMSRSSLQNLFKENLNIAPKQYINKVKLQKSKILIKESKYTISQIASMLGFNSVHYFSRKFSQHYKLAPTDYAKSIYSKEDEI